MSKIAFFCIPAHGHTNPTLGVARELVSRGHQVWYYSYEAMREKIEKTGAVFMPCDGFGAEHKITAEDGARTGRDLAFATRLLVDMTLALDEALCADMERLRPDCIVADSMAVWGRAVAMKLNIPFVSSTTTFAFNRYSAKTMKQSPAELIKMLLSMPCINKDVKRLRDSGYPIKSVLDIIQNDADTDTIVYTSPQFQPCAETFSDKYAFVGPSMREAGTETEKTREKLIYVSMGTVNNDMLPLYRNCVAAFGGGKHQVIMAVGEQVNLKAFGELPENISVYSRVDQISVLQKADVFISHCGMNSVSESLYYGVPVIALPQTPEQGTVAARVCQLGAGMMIESTGADKVKAAAEKVLADEEYRSNAEKIGRGFRQCGGAKAAADKILAVCGNV